MLKINRIEERFSLGKGTLFYMMSAFLVKFVGAIYKIPFFNILKEQGAGLYQMVFPLFSFIIILCGGYLPPLMTRLISEGNDGRKLLKKSLSIFLPLSLLFTVLLIIFSGYISRLQGSKNAKFLYIIISFAIIPTTSIFCLRGYFQGKGSFYQTAISQLTEQISKVILGLLFMILLSGSYVKKSSLACFALVISEFIALFYLVILYVKDIRMSKKDDFANRKEDAINNSLNFKKDITKLKLTGELLPMCLFSLCMPLASLTDSFIVVNNLKYIFKEESMAIFGLYTGAVQAVIMLPVGIINALSMGFLPRLSKTKGQKSHEKVFLTVFILSFISAVAVALSRNFIVNVLFHSAKNKQLLSRLLLFSSEIIVLLSLLQISNTIILSLGKQKFSLFSMVVGISIKVICNLFLVKIPQIHIFGMVISDVACYFVALIFNLLYIYKVNKRETAGIKNENHTCRNGNNGRFAFNWWSKGNKKCHQSNSENSAM